MILKLINDLTNEYLQKKKELEEKKAPAIELLILEKYYLLSLIQNHVLFGFHYHSLYYF